MELARHDSASEVDEESVHTSHESCHGTPVELPDLVSNPKKLQKCSILNTLGAEALVKFAHLGGKGLPEQPPCGGVGVGSSLPASHAR